MTRTNTPERPRHIHLHATPPNGVARTGGRVSISVVITVRNEAESIEACLGSIMQQSRVPDEVVVVDGGSTDGTMDILRRVAQVHSRLRAVSAPGSNISQGRNIGIEQATGRVIAVTDAGTILRPDWLAQLVGPLEADATIDVSAGFYVSGGIHFFERTLSATITPQLWEIDGETFLPSSRSVAFRKEAWVRVGGYPEWLRHCEDLIFDLDLKRAGSRFAFAPDAVVSWNARSSLSQYGRQYFHYARGDGQARLWPLRHAARYSAYGVGVALCVAAASGGALWAVPTAVLGMAGYFRKFCRRVWRRPPAPGIGPRVAALAFVPIIVITGDIAKMVGYPIGRLDRVTRTRRATGSDIDATARQAVSS